MKGEGTVSSQVRLLCLSGRWVEARWASPALLASLGAQDTCFSARGETGSSAEALSFAPSHRGYSPTSHLLSMDFHCREKSSACVTVSLLFVNFYFLFTQATPWGWTLTLFQGAPNQITWGCLQSWGLSGTPPAAELMGILQVSFAGWAASSLPGWGDEAWLRRDEKLVLPFLLSSAVYFWATCRVLKASWSVLSPLPPSHRRIWMDAALEAGWSGQLLIPALCRSTQKVPLQQERLHFMNKQAPFCSQEVWGIHMALFSPFGPEIIFLERPSTTSLIRTPQCSL